MRARTYTHTGLARVECVEGVGLCAGDGGGECGVVGHGQDTHTHTRIHHLYTHTYTHAYSLQVNPAVHLCAHPHTPSPVPTHPVLAPTPTHTGLARVEGVEGVGLCAGDCSGQCGVVGHGQERVVAVHSSTALARQLCARVWVDETV